MGVAGGVQGKSSSRLFPKQLDLLVEGVQFTCTPKQKWAAFLPYPGRGTHFPSPRLSCEVSAWGKGVSHVAADGFADSLDPFHGIYNEGSIPNPMET